MLDLQTSCLIDSYGCIISFQWGTVTSIVTVDLMMARLLGKPFSS